MDIALFRKVGDEAGALLVSGEASVVCDGRICSRVGLQAKPRPARDDEGGNKKSHQHEENSRTGHKQTTGHGGHK